MWSYWRTFLLLCSFSIPTEIMGRVSHCYETTRDITACSLSDYCAIKFSKFTPNSPLDRDCDSYFLSPCESNQHMIDPITSCVLDGSFYYYCCKETSCNTVSKNCSTSRSVEPVRMTTETRRTINEYERAYLPSYEVSARQPINRVERVQISNILIFGTILSRFI